MFSVKNANKTKFVHVTLVFDDCNRFSAHKGTNQPTHNDLIIEQEGVDMKKSNMKMSCLIANNVNTLQLEKID